MLHWCSQHCGTWTLDNGPPFDKPHYGSQASGGIVTVERFTRESVLMYRTDFRPYPGKAVLSGRISPDGNSILDGTIEWTYHPCCGLSKGSFQAAWGAAIDSVPGNDQERSARQKNEPLPPLPGAVAVQNAPETTEADVPGQPAWAGPVPKGPSPIVLPPGASPRFALFPSDLRAVLQPDAQIPEDVVEEFVRSPCRLGIRPPPGLDRNQLASDILEVGKFAYREFDFPRGFCWVQRSAELGNPRAWVILGAAYLYGLGVPKNDTQAFQYFDAIASRTTDVWAAYFIERCYLKGIGTPVDKQKANHVELWLALRPEGQAMYMSIGRDDLRVRREYEKMWTQIEPPTTDRRVCEYQNGREICHTESKVDQQRLSEELDAIDGKYAPPADSSDQKPK
ncbi:MAG: sel1 repeat family protein [Acidobacteriaceae bacterium]|nr:sel1 repeat family protein [Acidobacteriaceae bacterium]